MKQPIILNITDGKILISDSFNTESLSVNELDLNVSTIEFKEPVDSGINKLNFIEIVNKLIELNFIVKDTS